MTLTGVQLKAARQLLGWSQARLAGEIGISTTTISKFEHGTRRPPRVTLSAIRVALETAGIEFASGGSGVRLKAGK